MFEHRFKNKKGPIKGFVPEGKKLVYLPYILKPAE